MPLPTLPQRPLHQRPSRLGLVLLTLLLILPVTLPAHAAELAGVRLEDSVSVGDQKLVLNGLGLRKKLFIKVYVGGLYLPTRKTDAAAILAADAPRQITMHFLYDVSKDQLCDAWREGLDNNTPGASPTLRKDFDTLCSWMEDIDSGERMVLTYKPESGTRVTVNGKEKGGVAGKAFADAVFAAYIGPQPPSEDLKEGLLGG